ncbi:MAG: oligosaccharide flippase family protein, partial [Pseudomonadota bacterium]
MDPETSKTTSAAVFAILLRLSGAALGMGVHVVLARLLSVADYGLFAVALTIASLASVLVSLGMPFCAIKFLPVYVAERSEEKVRSFERTSLWLTAAGICAFSALTALVYAAWRAGMPATLAAALPFAIPMLIVLGFGQTLHSLLLARRKIVIADTLQTLLRPLLT